MSALQNISPSRPCPRFATEPQRNRIGPPITVSRLHYNLRHHAHCELLIEGLIKAGVPELSVAVSRKLSHFFTTNR
jgi:hypothetical protein